VRTLLQYGASVNTSAVADNQTPLLSALLASNERLVELLVEAGADVNVSMKKGTTALHIAAQQGNERMVRYLLEKGANVDVRGEDSKTPYLIAKEAKHDSIAQLLKEEFGVKYGLKRRKTVVIGTAAEIIEHRDDDNDDEEKDCDDEDGDRDDDLKDDKCCKICWEREANTVLLWCGHIAVCMYCTQFLHLCPICCQPIQKVQRVFLS